MSYIELPGCPLKTSLPAYKYLPGRKITAHHGGLAQLELMQPPCFMRKVKILVEKGGKGQVSSWSCSHNSRPGMLSTRWCLYEKEMNLACWSHFFFVHIAVFIILLFTNPGSVGIWCSKDLPKDDGQVWVWLKETCLNTVSPTKKKTENVQKL